MLRDIYDKRGLRNKIGSRSNFLDENKMFWLVCGCDGNLKNESTREKKEREVRS